MGRVQRRRIVFAGAGHASLIALDILAAKRLDAEFVLVSRASHAHYSGMVPGWIEGIYAEAEMAIDLRTFAQSRAIRFVSGEIVGADDTALHLSDRSIAHDLLVINTGAIARRGGPLASEHVVPAKPFERLIEGLRPDRGGTAFAIVGAGAAGVEVAFALRRRDPDGHIAIVERGPELLPAFPKRFGRRIASHLEQAGIDLHLRADVASVDRAGLDLVDGRRIAADRTLAFTGAAPPDWLGKTPFAKAQDGFLAVDARLRTSAANVLAVGDVASRVDDPRPKAGVFAVRTGPPLAREVERWLAGAPARPVILQRRGLVLLSLGGRRAIGVRNAVVAEGRWVWRLKDHLDRAFVGRLAREPALSERSRSA